VTVAILTAMTRAAPKRRAPAGDREQPDNGGGFGGILRGSVNSVVGATRLNVLVRAVERLTRAIEHATVMLERLERATKHLDRVDDRFIERVNATLGVLNRMGTDTRAIRKRMDSMEIEMHELRMIVTQRLDRVPLLRPRRRDRRAEATPSTASRKPS